MSNLKAAETYGEAIFQLAMEHNILEQMEEDLLYVKSLFTEVPDFKEFVEAPVIENHSKIPVLKEILQKSISTLALHFLCIMLQRGRARVIEAAVEEYVKKSREARGIATAKVWIARPIKPEVEQRIKEHLERETGKQIIMNVLVDPSIMAGVVVEIGDKRFDASLSRRLDQLKKALEGDTLTRSEIGVNESV